jgi:3-oxoacyl-[acyl-carrier protein] reductase
MTMRLKDKVALITGAGSGFGRASAVLFAKEGAKVVVADISDEGGKQTVNLLKKAGGEGIFVHTDVTKPSEVQQAIKTAMENYKKLDILYNNAGYLGKTAPVENLEEAVWDYVYAVNVKSIFLGAKYAAPEMKKRGGGVILNTASVSGDRPRPNMTAYSSSKGAAETLTKGLAVELAPFNIRVNCISPVAADTPMLPQFAPAGADKAAFIKALASTIPLRRLATAEDVAYAALYLASDEASLITGVILQVDGGRNV